MLIGQRIKELRKAQKLSQGGLGEKLDLGQSAVSNWENGYTTPQTTDLKKIANVLGVDVEILMNDIDLSKVDINPHQNTKLIPFLSVSAYATFIEMVGQHKYEVTEKIPVYDLTGEDLDERRHIVIEVTGSSMEPTLYDKSRVLFEAVPENDIKYINSGIYAIVFDSHFVIKRVKENELLNSKHLTLYSDNPNAGSLKVPQEQIKKVWKAIDIVKQRLI